MRKTVNLPFWTPHRKGEDDGFYGRVFHLDCSGEITFKRIKGHSLGWACDRCPDVGKTDERTLNKFFDYSGKKQRAKTRAEMEKEFYRPFYPVGRIEPYADYSDKTVLRKVGTATWRTKDPSIKPDSIIAIRASGHWPPDEWLRMWRDKPPPPTLKLAKALSGKKRIRAH